MKQIIKQQNKIIKIEFLFDEALFPDAYIEYADRKKAKSLPAKSGKSIFKWEGVQLHHVSVGVNQVDYLVYNGIIICSFPLKKNRNEVYAFIEKYWKERISKFVKYIDERRGGE